MDKLVVETGEEVVFKAIVETLPGMVEMLFDPYNSNATLIIVNATANETKEFRYKYYRSGEHVAKVTAVDQTGLSQVS